MTHLYLIRHGEAVSNVEPIIGGTRGDRGLTARGVAQAERLRDRLAAGDIIADVLIASTMPRARQTAEIIAPALGLPIVWDDEVQEMRPGEADGLSLQEYDARFGFPDFERDPFRPLAPGGESWTQFIVRVAGALNRITRQHQGKTVVIVCHGGIVDGSFVSFFGLPALTPPRARFNTNNTSITHWEHHAPEGEPARWRLMRYNDDAHLRGLGVEAPVAWADRGAGEPAVPLPSEKAKEP